MEYGILKAGAGGAVTGIDIQCDLGVGACSAGTGTVTKLSRNNTNGAYWFNANATNCGNAGAKGCWQQIVTVHSLPANDPSITDGLRGAYDAVIAPSNTSHFWMIYDGYIYSSTNKGANWTRCNIRQDTDDEANGVASGGLSRHIAVDPANEWSVLIATPTSGVSYSDGTASGCENAWTTITTSAIPDSTVPHVGHLIAFDPSTTRAGSTPGIYIFSHGHGVYHTSNGPNGTWSLTPGGPTTFAGTMIVDDAGNVWTIDASTLPLGGANGGIGVLWERHSGVWSRPPVRDNKLNDVAVNPAVPARIYALHQGDDRMYVSTDAGSTWSRPTPPNKASVTTDIPWLGYRLNGNQALYGNPGSRFDPSAENTLYVAGGLGIYITNPPTSSSLPTPLTYTSVSAAIEQLVVNQVVAPPGGTPVIAPWDQCVIKPNSATYPSVAGIVNNTIQLQSGWSVDWASSSANTIVALCQGINDAADSATSGISSDGGAKWRVFANQVSTGENGGIFGGCIAASTPTNILQVQSNQPPGFPIYYTTDGGSSWSQPDGSLNTIKSGWPPNFYQNFRDCAADRVMANTFYLFNFNTGSGDAVYQSTNGGLTWKQQCHFCAGGGRTFGATGAAGMLKSAPGLAGHLCFTTASDFNGTIRHNFWCSRDAGVTWTASTNVEQVLAFGFGAVKTGNTECGGKGCPSLYLAGKVNLGSNYSYGFWRSDDFGKSWVKVGDGYPLGDFGPIADIDGDKDTYGTFYICTRNAGCYYGKLNFLLNRDFDPTSNGNSPAGLNPTA
jgi:hypothetical protein